MGSGGRGGSKLGNACLPGVTVANGAEISHESGDGNEYSLGRDRGWSEKRKRTFKRRQRRLGGQEMAGLHQKMEALCLGEKTGSWPNTPLEKRRVIKEGMKLGPSSL